MNREQKHETVESLRQTVGAADFLVLADYKGLDVEQVTVLRKTLRKENVEMKVAKNTLLRLAFKDSSRSVLSEDLHGPTAVVYGDSGGTAPAKLLLDFRKTNEKLEIKSGYLNGKRLSLEQIERIGKLPDRDTLRAKLLSALVGVPRMFVGLLAAAPRNFVGVLEARRRELENAG